VPELDTDDLLARATRAARERWPGATLDALEPLEGGVSSLTYAARLAHDGATERVVVKVAPPGLPPVRNRDVLRQARVLKALAGAEGVRVPEVLVEDAGSPPFFVMSFVEGQSYEPAQTVLADPPAPEVVGRRARAAARMLARLQAVDPAAVGLGDEPALSLAEELDRWARLYETVPDDLRDGERELYGRLAAAVPEPVAPRILHGDFRMGNMQFAGDELAAIIDWEIWSVGDPRTDLGWLVTYLDPIQVFVEDRGPANRRSAEGLPTPAELLAAYRAAGGPDPGDLAWFEAYARYKIASTTAALAKHNRRRLHPDRGLEIGATWIPALIRRGLKILDDAEVAAR
jgi:aminoglycoside phosphotransferase (APT) family kinase protein